MYAKLPPRTYENIHRKQTFKKTWKLFGLFFTISNCRVKKRQPYFYNRSLYNKHDYKDKLYEQNGGVCPHCGKMFDIKEMELHHVLPYARFQDYGRDKRNILLLCKHCHKEIHCNPYWNIRLIEQKAAELGVDLNERYNKI